MGARFNVTYNIDANTTAYYVVDLPTDEAQLKVSGSCTTANSNSTEENIKIEFMKKADQTFAWYVNFGFEKTADSKQQVKVIDFMYDTSVIAGAEVEIKTVVNNDTYGSITADNSYLCKAKQDIMFETAMLSLTNVQLQAYSKDTSKFSGKPVECSLDAYTSNIVPIAVGAALAALVVIVLIAYLVSRSRNQTGYESV